MATRIPYEFATAGDTEEIPDTSSSDELSWQDGWSEAYAKESTEAGYRYIDRSEMNYLFKVLSANIKEWQEQLFPAYSDEISYQEGMVVRYTDDNFYTSNTTTTAGSIPSDLVEWDEYESNSDLKTMIENNTQQLFTIMTSVSTNGSAIDDLEDNKLDASGVQSVTGTATFTNSTNNVNLTDIGAQGWEIGDVIQFSGSDDNDKLFTIEFITDDDNIIVNYEHRGGTTSKSLVDETATVTCSLVCKWYVAPDGLGQGWCIPASSRVLSTEYTNGANRNIIVNAGDYSGTGRSFRGTVSITDGVEFANQKDGTSNGAIISIYGSVGVEEKYTINVTVGSITEIWERR